VLLACSPSAPAPLAVPPGARPGASLPTAVTSAAPTPPAPWELSAELSRMHPATSRAPSEHLTGELDGEVFVNEAAGAYPALGPRRELAPGATLVERHLERGSEKIAVYFAMVKRPAGYDPDGGDWEYLVVAADGQVEERGRLPLCARCHADAPHDHLFGGALRLGSASAGDAGR